MGNNKEPSIEQSAPQIEDEMGECSETNSSLEQEVSQAEDGKLLNTYKWHKNETPRAMERLEKEASVKWNKMQNWRKSLSEDAAEKISTSTQRVDSLAKPDKPIKKNPFRRALSEPAGSLLSSVLSSSSSASSSGQTSGSTAQDTAQKGKLRKYLLNVSQKFKRVCLQSSSIPEHETDNCQSENVVQNTVRLSWAPPQDVFVWDISSISLQDGQIFISPEEDPILMRNQTSSGLFNQSLQNISVSHVELNPDPVVPQSSGKVKGQDGGVKGLIKRRLQNDDKRKSSTQLNTAGLIATGRIDSRESLAIPVVAAKSLDLSADQSTVIRPVHSSILGEKYCFQVINSENNHCFGCSSAAERDRWIEDLRRTAHPSKDNCERTECSLSLWINEAKDLFPKKRYYCEIHLDGTLFARTSSRAVGKSSQVVDGGSSVASPGHHSGVSGGYHLFWGEFFELDSLPPVTQITLHLFKDEDPKKKRYSKDDSVLHPLGSVALALADIKGRAYQEKWFPIVPYRPVGVTVLKDQVGSQASLRVKAKFQKLNVLPIERYKEFAEYVTLNYVEMCSSLEPLLNVREKEELAVALVHVLQSIGKAKEFLIELGSAEVQRLGENEALIFRENTLVTKAIDEYMKLVGQKYLIDTLGDFISRLYSVGESCEVDPLKCSASDLTINQRHLKETCGDVVKRITDMQDSFPAELNDIFSNWVSDCEERGLQDIGHRLISATLFLRFLCPAILSPSLFKLTQPYPEPNTLRTLTLTAKVIQNLANFTLFGDKEEYMLFMNEFLEQHWETMRAFLQRVSNSDPDMPMARFDGYVDLPLRLAVLHNILVDKISVMKQNQIDNLCPLPSILNQITEFLGEDVQLIPASSSGTPKPTYIPPKDLPKYSPLHNSMQQLPVESKTFQVRERQRKQVQRAFSVPNRPNRHPRQSVKRQASNEELPSQDQEMLQDPPIVISSPTDQSSKSKVPPAPVPWIKQLESSQITQVQEEANPVNKKTQELAELHLAMDQMAERELDMAKRLEDFIVQSQEKNEQLQADIQELRNLLTIREEQLASAAFRLGVIEEEREEDERKLTVAVAAVERMNVLEEQFAGLLKDVHQLYAVNSDDIRKAFINT